MNSVTISYHLCLGKILGQNHIEWSFRKIDVTEVYMVRYGLWKDLGAPERGYTYLLGRQETRYDGDYYWSTFYVGNSPLVCSEGRHVAQSPTL